VGTVVGLEGGAAVLVVVVVLVLLVVSAAVVDVVEGASVVGPEVAGDGTAGVVAGGDETDVQAARKANRTIGRRTGPRLAAVAGEWGSREPIQAPSPGFSLRPLRRRGR